MQRACERYTDIFGEPPRTHGAAGWQMNVHALRLTQRLGFDYCSDGRGTHPHLPVWNARADPLPAVADDAADARRADRPRRHHRRPTSRRICSSARATCRPRRSTRCTPSSRACASRRCSSSSLARLEGAGLDARSSALAVRQPSSRWRCRAATSVPAPSPGAPARCSCSAPNFWATSISATAGHFVDRREPRRRITALANAHGIPWISPRSPPTGRSARCSSSCSRSSARTDGGAAGRPIRGRFALSALDAAGDAREAGLARDPRIEPG